MIKYFCKLFNWIVWEPIFTWVTIIVMALPFLKWGTESYSELWFRSWGSALQLLGIIVTVITIWLTLRDANKPMPLQLFKRWWSLRPTIRRSNAPVRDLSANVMSSATLTGTAAIYEDTVEGKLSALSDRIAAVEKEFVAVKTSVMDHDKQIQIIKEESEAGDTQLADQMIEHQTGHLHWAAMGASWLFLGVILAGWAPELTKCFVD